MQDKVIREIPVEHLPAASADGDDWGAAPTSALIEHIRTRYHAVHLAELPRLCELAREVEDTHRGDSRVPAGLAALLRRLLADIRIHQKREEVVLFPLLLQDGHATAKAAIRTMRAEHDDHHAALARIDAITDGRRPPPHAGATWRALCLGLTKFRSDLTQHVHLENNVLFPRYEQERT